MPRQTQRACHGDLSRAGSGTRRAVVPLVNLDSTGAGGPVGTPGCTFGLEVSAPGHGAGDGNSGRARVASAPGRIFRAAGRRGAKRLAQAILPQSVVAWHGRETRPGTGGVSTRTVALTFDDGPTELTLAYLEVLARFGVRATFFVVGEQCAARPDLVSAIANAGHELAGHGYTHRQFPGLSAEVLREELTRTAALLPRCFCSRRLVRPPHGAVSLSSIFTCATAGFTTALWSHDSGDWCTTSAEGVCAALDDERALVPGSVVLLHEGQPWTLRALPTVLGKLSEAGHDLVTMGELLDG